MDNQDELEKLSSIKPLLKDVLEDIHLSLDVLESYLLENIKTIEAVKEKKEDCQLIIEIGRILREFPRKVVENQDSSPKVLARRNSRNQSRTNVPTAISPFLQKIDLAFDAVRSKLEVVSDFVDQTQSLSFGLTLALVLKDIKMILAKEEMIEEELPRRQSFAKGQSIEALNKLTNSPILGRHKPNPDLMSSSPTTSSPGTPPMLRSSSGSSLNSDQNMEEDPASQVKTQEEAIQQMAKALIAEKKRSLKKIRPRSNTSALDTRKPLSEVVESMLGNDTHLSNVLKDPLGAKQFRAFLKKERSEEHIDFLEAVAKWKQTANPNDKKKATEIYDNYIKDGCAKEVNISAKFKRDIESDVSKDQIKLEVFDKAESSVLMMLEEDSFKRFLKSDEFKHYVKASGYKKISGKKPVKGGALDDLLIVLEQTKM